MSEAGRDIYAHVAGGSLYVDDLPEPRGTLHAAVLGSPVPHGRILRLDVTEARKAAGIAAVVTAADVPGENQIGGIIPDETLLAKDHVGFAGEPVAVVIGETLLCARRALALIDLEIEELPAIVDPREAYTRGEVFQPPRTFALGDIDEAWADCDVVVEGRADSGGQEHFYLEGQAAMAVPGERGRLVVYSSTQGPTTVQRTVARVLGIPMHQVEVDVGRIGGGFGGKEDQATAWAVMASLAAVLTGRPVKLVLRRREDMLMTGKRHPYSSDYRIGLNREGKILAYQVMLYQNAGAFADLSTAVLERSLFHATGSYYIPNVRATAASCRTNIVPSTAFRGFGGPQAMFVIESAITHAAAAMGKTREEIQRINLLAEGDMFPYGMRTERCRAERCWDEAVARYDLPSRRADVSAFNARSTLRKKGLAVMPVCFGISFTNIALNQGRALVHIYTDGSVGVSTGAVEMGQGVNEKICRIVSMAFQIAPEQVRIETTNTTRIANTSATAASCGSDLNGRAAQLACGSLLSRLIPVAADLAGEEGETDLIAFRAGHVCLDGRLTDVSWESVVAAAYQRRVNLTEHAHYATPDIWFDTETEKGRPFAYHAFGAAITEVTVDCLRGTYTVDAVRCVHDVGETLHQEVDLGQIEGGIVQGIGWMTVEDLVFAPDGKLSSDNTSKYKVPDLKSTPEIETRLLGDAPNPHAVFGSKAVGEPPLMYGIGTYFALLDAMRAFRPNGELFYHSPMTPEKVLCFLHGCPPGGVTDKSAGGGTSG